MLFKMLCDSYSAVTIVAETGIQKSIFSCFGVEGLDADEFLED